MASKSTQILSDLRAQIRRIETSQCNPRRLGRMSSGFESLDRILPHKGFIGGTLIEWLGAGEGHGAMTLALAVGAQVVRDEGMLVVVGDGRTLFPPALAGLGVPLERSILVQPKDQRTKLWAWEQALRCEAIAVTMGPMESASTVVMRRLQLAVEAGGGIGFLVRPFDGRAETSWAEVRLLVKALPSLATSNSMGWRLQVELLRCRGGEGGVVEIEVNHEADDVRVDTELARPARSA